MADLSVRLEYRDKSKSSFRSLLEVTVPFWGFIPAAVFCFGLFELCTAHESLRILRGLYYIIFSIAIPLLVLSLIHYLNRSSLLIDRSGIELPPDILKGRFRSQHLSWNDLANITVSGEQKNKCLMLWGKNGGTAIELNRLDNEDAEKLLVALDLFYKGEKDGPALENLGSILKLENRSQLAAGSGGNALGDLSFTELWEDELKRRFKAAAFMPLAPGLIMRGGSLKIIRQLALGGLSAVYLGQLNDNKLVVLKESVVPEDAKPEIKLKAEEMFAREAQLLLKINHPNVVKVLDYFVENERSYLLLDYVNGRDLRQIVKQNGRVRQFQVVDWARQIADILNYLHGQEPPILHRDLTPDNLVVRDDGSIVVIDFGAANEFIGNATGTFVGKQAFIAPEQFRGKACAASDIYAFGGTLFYLLTGQDPEALSSSSPAQIVETDEALDKLISDCTNPELEERISSAELILERLKEIKTG